MEKVTKKTFALSFVVSVFFILFFPRFLPADDFLISAHIEIQNKGRTAKRYPLSLGRDPFTRELYQDNKTTPEGLYRIINLQEKATFYKAIDINYPNAADRLRYDFLKTEGLVPTLY